MFNLVEVQTALQSPSVQLADLMKYANGSSAEVPAYLALGELNRRKQLEATNTAFNATPPTVKDQLTNAPPAVNPTAAPTGLAPTGAPQLASAVAAPPRMNVAAAPANQVNPAVPPQLAAEGGLMSIPTPHMFKQESYATGGIVAFSGTDDSFVDPKLVERPTIWDKITGKAKDKQEKFDRQSKMLAADYSGDASDLELPANAPPHPYAIEAYLNSEQKAARRKGEGTDVNHPSPVNPAEDKRQDLLKAQAAQAAADKASHDALVAQVPAWHTGSDGTIKGTKPAEAPVDAAPAAKSGIALLPRNKPVDDFNKIPAAGIATPAPVLPPVTVERDARQDYKALTAAERQAATLQQMEDDKALRLKAGISDDPHKDTKERMDKLEAKRAGQEKEDSKNELINFLAKISESKRQGFGAAMGEGAESTGKLTKENAALRDKQATETIAARQAMETAEDARKRGDLTTAKAATEEAQKHKEKAEELRIHADTALAALQTAQTGETYHEGALELARQEQPYKNSLLTAQAWHYRNPQATEAMIAKELVPIIQEDELKRTGKPISRLEAMALISEAKNPSKGETIEQKNRAAFSAAKLMDPTLTYPKYLAQFDTPPDSSKIQAGRAAMKP